MTLFSPIQVGDVSLGHRVVLAPLTRFKADLAHVPFVPIVKEHYLQRASTPGTLLISEATLIAPQAGGYDHAPGIWSPEQIAAWKEIVESIHASGSSIYLQLWALGRAAEPQVITREGFKYKAPSPIPLTNRGGIVPDGDANAIVVPEELTVKEMKEYLKLYATAASNAVHLAGFDGVEVHNAHGYLLDEFLQDVTNQRTDEYGGSIENRARFSLEVIDVVVKAVGATKVGIRLSPWSLFQQMRMKDPIPQFTYLVKEIKAHYPDFSYLSIVEPRVSGYTDRDVVSGETNDGFREIWAPKPYISAGRLGREDAIQLAEKNENELVAFGRYFISNPDLVHRLKENIPFTPYDRSTFYVAGDASGKGYIDYPFADA